MPRTKVKKISELKNILLRLKKAGKSIVFTNGCFDLLHFGHVQYLEKAKAKGSCLIVGINSDSSVKKIKGLRRPIVNEIDRAGIIAGLASVDYVVIFKETTPYKLIKQIKPDILIKGSDWKKLGIIGSDLVKKVATIKLSQGRSTSKLIEKIARAYKN